jgi:hypothetical protein
VEFASYVGPSSSKVGECSVHPALGNITMASSRTGQISRSDMTMLSKACGSTAHLNIRARACSTQAYIMVVAAEESCGHASNTTGERCDVRVWAVPHINPTYLARIHQCGSRWGEGTTHRTRGAGKIDCYKAGRATSSNYIGFGIAQHMLPGAVPVADPYGTDTQQIVLATSEKLSMYVRYVSNV